MNGCRGTDNREVRACNSDFLGDTCAEEYNTR